MIPDRDALAAAVSDAFDHAPDGMEMFDLAEHVADAVLAGPLAPVAPGGDGLPESVLRDAMLAASGTRRTLDENIAAAAEVAYAAGRADERAAVAAWLYERFSVRAHALADRIKAGEHLGD